MLPAAEAERDPALKAAAEQADTLDAADLAPEDGADRRNHPEAEAGDDAAERERPEPGRHRKDQAADADEDAAQPQGLDDADPFGELRAGGDPGDRAEVEEGPGDQADARQREVERGGEVGNDRADVAGAPRSSRRHQKDRDRVAAAEGGIAHRRLRTTRTSSRARLAPRLVTTSIP